MAQIFKLEAIAGQRRCKNEEYKFKKNTLFATLKIKTNDLETILKIL